jgi:hypothetical protein
MSIGFAGNFPNNNDISVAPLTPLCTTITTTTSARTLAPGPAHSKSTGIQVSSGKTAPGRAAFDIFRDRQHTATAAACDLSERPQEWVCGNTKLVEEEVSTADRS